MAGFEAHVEHAVDLVENEDFDAAEVDEPAVEVVFEAARGWATMRRAPATDGFELRAFGEAAADQRPRCLCFG